MQSSLEITVGRQKIAACLHRPDPGRSAVAAPVVVCCHGLTGTRVGSSYRYVTLARRLVAENIACLRFDFRGCGESDGRFEDVTAAALQEDLLAVMAAVDHLPNCDPTCVGMIGSSFGAFTISMCANRIPSLRSLVFLAPVADPAALIARDMSEAAWSLVRKQGWIDHHGQKLGAGFLDTLPTENGPARLAPWMKPLLIYHGSRDHAVPPEQGQAYEAVARARGVEAKFVSVESGDHGMRTVLATEQIIEGSVAWLRRFLHPDLPVKAS